MGRTKTRGSKSPSQFTTRDLARQLAADGESLMPRTNRYIPHLPHAGPQQLFLSPIVTPLREVFYGGAARGGKTEALLIAALQFIDLPHYKAVLVRRTYPMLSQSEGLIERAASWLDTSDAVYNEGKHRWSFPNGSALYFRHLQNDQALADYQGSEYQFIGIDEVTDLTERQYRFLFSRLTRLEGVTIPLRVRSASNPTGRGRDWVYTRFVTSGPRSGRLFIPAHLEDNPAVDQREYERSLVQLGHVDYRRLRYGDWEIRSEGRMFKRSWFEVVLPEDVPEGVKHVRYWDLAGETPDSPEMRKLEDRDWIAGVLLARSSEGVYYVDHVERFRGSSLTLQRRIRGVAEADGRDVPIRIEQEPGGSAAHLISILRRDLLREFDVRGVKSTGSKETRAAPIAARAEAGEVKLVRGPWNQDFIDELAEFPAKDVHDDQVDALSGAFDFLAVKGSTALPMPGGSKGQSYWRE